MCTQSLSAFVCLIDAGSHLIVMKVAVLRGTNLGDLLARDAELDIVDAYVFDVVLDNLAHFYQMSMGV